jgi:serine/threonine protein kinase
MSRDPRLSRDPDRVLKEGWLYKKGSIMGRFRRIFCSVTRTAMAVQDGQPIPLSSSTQIHVVKVPEFAIVSASGVTKGFVANSQDDLLSWVTALRQAVCLCTDLSMASFEILSVLGRGHFGKVMLCRRVNTTKLYAIKSVRKEGLTGSQVKAIFDERDVLTALRHPFLVSLAFTFQTESKVYFGLDYVPGGELRACLRERHALPIDEVRVLAGQVALALIHMHDRLIVYRDLKPENILMDERGYIRITDFGLSKKLEFNEAITKTFCGTPDYIAPEMIAGKGYGIAVDWWSFGILTYQMLCGVTPFRGSSDVKTYENISKNELVFKGKYDPDAVDVITQLLQKDPAKRLCGRDILDHPFFQPVHWGILLERGLEMLWKPTLQNGVGATDPDSAEIAADSWAEPGDAEQAAFRGFSFTNEEIIAADGECVNVTLG